MGFRLEFLFDNEFKDICKKYQIKSIWSLFPEGIKGLTTFTPKQGIINLNASDWKNMEEDELIIDICKTITHETCHYAIDTGDNNPIGYTRAGEELVCMSLANQLFEHNFRP